MSDFAAGHFAKPDLQQVYVGICSGSMYVSVSRFGSYRPRYTLMPYYHFQLHISENPSMSARVDSSSSEYSCCTILGNETATECRVTPTCQAGGEAFTGTTKFVSKYISPAYFLIHCREVLGLGI